MRLSWLFASAAAFAGVLSQEVNVTLITSLIPFCALECSATNLVTQGCELTDVRNCLCTNVTLQTDLFLCVQSRCNITEQLIITTVAQDYICQGIPQPSRSAEIVRTVAIIAAVTFLIIGLRVYSRFALAHLWWDDWMIIITSVFILPMAVLPIYNAGIGFGEHAWNVKAENIIPLRKTYYASQVFYTISLNTVKLSILFLYLRIFPGERFRFWVKLVMWFLGATCFSFTFAVIFQCIPFQSIFDTTIPGKCYDTVRVVFAGAAISIFNDVLLIILPVPTLMKLPMSVKRRVVLVFMFAIGSFAMIASIIRLRYIYSFSLHSYDGTWENTDVVIWSILEIYMAAICASIMAIRPLLSKYFPKLFPTAVNSNFSYESKKVSLRPPLPQSFTGKIWSPNNPTHGIELSSTENLSRHANQPSLETSMGIQKTTQFDLNINPGEDIERKSSESRGDDCRKVLGDPER